MRATRLLVAAACVALIACGPEEGVVLISPAAELASESDLERELTPGEVLHEFHSALQAGGVEAAVAWVLPSERDTFEEVHADPALAKFLQWGAGCSTAEAYAVAVDGTIATAFCPETDGWIRLRLEQDHWWVDVPWAGGKGLAKWRFEMLEQPRITLTGRPVESRLQRDG